MILFHHSPRLYSRFREVLEKDEQEIDAALIRKVMKNNDCDRYAAERIIAAEVDRNVRNLLSGQTRA